MTDDPRSIGSPRERNAGPFSRFEAQARQGPSRAEYKDVAGSFATGGLPDGAGLVAKRGASGLAFSGAA